MNLTCVSPHLLVFRYFDGRDIVNEEIEGKKVVDGWMDGGG